MYYKSIFYTSLMTGTFIAISSYSWMGMWMGLEINLLSIIPLISNTNNMMASEAALKYFVTQALASTLLLFSIISLSMTLMYNINPNLYISLILNTAILMKVGAAPFHFWFPEIMEGLSWINATIMLTWQKIAPLVILMYSYYTVSYLTMSIISCMMISGIMGNNQTNLRKILTYSSINHIGWMIATIMFFNTIWMYYFIVYTIITLNITLIFSYLNIFYLKQLFMSMNKNTMIKFFFIMNFLSLGGLPPFLGFLPKWITIQMMIENSSYMLVFIMMVLTLMTLYFYIQITYSTILLQMNEITWNKPKNQPKFWIMLFNFMSLTSLILSTMIFNFI
uniref:NADH-ubiquinone oxidoreductase chain 2 n=1 Tax=Pleophylla sp. PLE01 TaxID=1205642 RepID=A0A0S2MNC8_9SCAR|nr:NADH deshydrogenase subunit 2 [Pleophylla sp. PLE01]